MIDTHAHLDACAEPPQTLIDRAHAAGVRRILTVGTTPWGSEGALGLARRHAGVFAIVGVHPHEAARAEDDWLARVCRLTSDGRAVAVGEIGLDYHRDAAPRDAQRRLFDAALAMASDASKPVVIHTRAADADTAAALAGFAGTVVLHCFSSPPLLPVALERGYYVSFAGNVTYPNASELRAAAAAVPADRLLVETDAPYLSPQPRRGRPNEPANVVHTLAALADTRGEDPGELERRVDANARAAFGLP